MHIILAKTFNEAPCLIHFITDISITDNSITALVSSHASVGGRMFWQERITIPSSRMTANVRDAVMAYLVEPGQYLAGGVIGDIATETNAAADLRMMTIIDEEREIRMMNELTAGGAKKYEYSAKLREWQDFTMLGVAAAVLLPLIDQRNRWPWAMAEVAESGDTLQVVMARFKGGIDKSALARRIAARAQSLKRQMRAATTFAARKAIFDARTWPVS